MRSKRGNDTNLGTHPQDEAMQEVNVLIIKNYFQRPRVLAVELKLFSLPRDWGKLTKIAG